MASAVLHRGLHATYRVAVPGRGPSYCIPAGDHFDGSAAFTARFDVNIEDPLEKLRLGHYGPALNGSSRVVSGANTSRNDRSRFVAVQKFRMNGKSGSTPEV